MLEESTNNYPSVGETLAGYLDRCNIQLEQIEQWSAQHVNWYTHRSAGACWICDVISLARLMTNIMQDVMQEIPQKKFVSERAKGAPKSDVRYYEFRIHPKG